MTIIIGPGLLNFRVRDGNGCDQSGIHARVMPFYWGNLRFINERRWKKKKMLAVRGAEEFFDGAVLNWYGDEENSSATK